MPKQPGGLSKFQRVEAVREVLNRWGKLNKNQIDERVAAKLGCESAEISRSLYRDLEVLEEMGQITSVHFTRDGQKIDDYNPDLHKNTVCEWSIAQSKVLIRGSKRLMECGVTLRVSPRLVQSVSVSDGTPLSSEHSALGLYFHIGGSSHSIMIKWDALPFRICICRGGSEPDIANISPEEEKVLGKRAICISVPFKSVSSFKGAGQPGHLTLTFEEPSSFQVLDYKSKNGTFYNELTGGDAATLVKKNASSNKATSTHLLISKSIQGKQKQIKEGESTKLSLPTQVYVSLEFCLIILGFS